MTFETTSLPGQICRYCDSPAPVDVHFCPSCSRILPFRRDCDYFAYLGVRRKLNLDPAELEQRFRLLSRRLHPDGYYNASPAERQASLERTSYLNDAYRTLKQLASRATYLLELEAHRVPSPLPARLLEEVFAFNEELEAIRLGRTEGKQDGAWKDRFDRARQPIDRRWAACDRELDRLSDAWDALTTRGAPDSERALMLSALQDCLREREYLGKVLSAADEERLTWDTIA